jgi:hypothetical protein
LALRHFRAVFEVEDMLKKQWASDRGGQPLALEKKIKEVLILPL